MFFCSGGKELRAAWWHQQEWESGWAPATVRGSGQQSAVTGNHSCCSRLKASTPQISETDDLPDPSGPSCRMPDSTKMPVNELI